jgi:hypothetical protein
MSKAIGFLFLAVVVFYAVLGAVACGMLSSRVLSYFSVHVPWYVCSVAMFILGGIFGAGRSK